MRRLRAAWFAFVHPDRYVSVDPAIIKIHAPLDLDVAREIRLALKKLDRIEGKR